MGKGLKEIAGLLIEESGGVPGIRGRNPIRLTRPGDGASLLLHEIEQNEVAAFSGAAFETGAPDFSRPFLTHIVGLLHYEGRAFLVEPLPPAVPLIRLWVEVLQNSPSQSLAVARAMTGQLCQILRELKSAGRVHGAVFVENIVLTTNRTYGLLQARFRTNSGWLWLRPPATPRAGIGGESPSFSKVEYIESPGEVLLEMASIAARSGLLKPIELLALQALAFQL